MPRSLHAAVQAVGAPRKLPTGGKPTGAPIRLRHKSRKTPPPTTRSTHPEAAPDGWSWAFSFRYKSHSIPNLNPAATHHRCVHARVVLVEAHDRLQDAPVLFCGFWIEVEHHTSCIAQRNA